MNENWMPVVGYEGLYSVSDQGRIRSEDRSVLRRTAAGNQLFPVRGRILRQQLNLEGYWTVTLCRDGRKIKFSVHSIALRAFTGAPAPGQVTRHLDSNKLNNALTNLVWGSQRENILDQVAAGTHSMSSKTHCPQGHPYDDNNTYPTRSGSRLCRECRRISNRLSYRRRKAAAQKTSASADAQEQPVDRKSA